MKKNLKKVISAVIALAMSVSSVAMAAPKFSDVADTAASANAINALASLGVISGYDDGTFKPDNNITRAEVATMVVAALNRSADAEGSKGTTKFADVNTDAKAWASGYVNIGVAEGYISGYEDGTFKPDNNVTYAEMVSMLVRMVGYGEYAEYLGGWPNGYLSVGNDKGITAGVSASQDAAVTRAQVAQMIYNSIVDVCKVSSTSFTTTSEGKIVPVLTEMNGQQNNTRAAKDYQTILTEKFDAYYVEGFVEETSRTEGLTAYDADEVLFRVRYAENYDDDWYLTKSDAKTIIAGGNDTASIKVKVGDTDAADYLNTYAAAIIKVDDDEATIVSFIPSGKNNTVTFATNLYEEDEIDWTKKDFTSISFNQTKDASKATKYKLDNDVTMYVNGKSVSFTEANYNKYIVNNTSGTVELVDRYDVTGAADGKYDIFNVTYYATAMVSAVNASNKGRVTFSTSTSSAYINLDEDDDELAFTIHYNGEEIGVEALKADDVLSIMYDVTADNLAKSEFYEIYVSRDTAEGKYTGMNSGNETFTVGGTEYEAVAGYVAGQSLMNLSYEYTLYLDVFGRIYDVQVLTSSAKYAVVDKFYKKSSGDDYKSVLLYTMDGTTKTAEVDFTASGVTMTEDELVKKIYDETNKDVNGNIKETTDNKTPIQERVVEYKISSSTGKVTTLKFLDAQGSSSADADSYNANKMTIGTVKMNDATKVIDATDYDEGTTDATYSNLAMTTPSVLTDDNNYTAYAFGERNNSDKTYPLVIVTSAGGSYSSETMFAVLTETPAPQADDDDEFYAATVLYGNEEIDVRFDDDTKGYYMATGTKADYKDLVKGDVIIFTKNANNTIKSYDVIAKAADLGIDDASLKGANDQSKYFMDKAFAKTAMFAIDGDRQSDFSNWTGAWTNKSGADLGDGNATAGNLNLSKDVTRLVYGPVMDVSSGSFTLGSIGENGTDLFTNVSKVDGSYGSVIEVDTDASTNVYVYDFSYGINSSSRLQCNGAMSTGTNDNYAEGTADDYFNWKMDDADNTIRNCVSFALVRMVDGEAKDVLLIMPTNVK